MSMSSEELQAYEPIMQRLIEMGVPLLEGLLAMPLMEPKGQMETAKELLGNLPEGITHFILHPSIETAELRAIAPDWESRVANYNTFMSDELKEFIEAEDIILIGYRQIRDAMRQG
jgi:hypothetical protein